jgi:hypothetical protein
LVVTEAKSPTRSASLGRVSQASRCQRYVEAIVTTPTWRAAADVADVDECTLRRAAKRPEVAEAIARRVRELRSEALTAVAAGMPEAVAALRSIVADASDGGPTRVRAASELLSFGTGEMTADVEQRLAELEGRGTRWPA